MLIGFMAVGGIILIAMVLRFVQPQLLYGVRRFLREVRTNKATLDFAAGRPAANRELVAALMRDGRPETEDATAGAARRRANKLRELYRILDPRNPLPDGIERHQDPRVCLIELAELVRNLAQQIKPSLEHNRAVIPCGSLLRYMGTTIRHAEGDESELREEDLGNWYIDNPISMEQVIEILIAVVEGMSFRLQAEEEAATRITREHSTLEHIMRLERMLRALVRARYLANQRINPEDRIRDMLGAREYELCTHRMEKARVNADVNVDFLDFLYFRQLEQLIVADWELFEYLLQDRDWFARQMERIIKARNEVTHSRELLRAEDEAVKRACQEIAERIRETVGW